MCFGVWTGWNVGTPVCCNSRALPQFDFYFLTQECRNPAVQGFWENVREGRYVLWDKPSRYWRPKLFSSLIFVATAMWRVGVWQNMHVNVSSEPQPLPFVNRNSCSLRFFLLLSSHLSFSGSHSLWSVPAIRIQWGKPAVLLGLWAVQTVIQQIQPA